MQRYIEKEALLVSISKKRQMMVEAAEIYGYTGDERSGGARSWIN